MLGWRLRPAVPVVLALLITVYGGLLRLDAFVQKYGALDHPGWARVLTHQVAPLARWVEPAKFRWWTEPHPYVGGDPINYLRYAREMRSFYQAHVREPVFLALTRAWLWSLSDQDAGVSFASVLGSTLTLLGVYLLAASFISRAAGLAAALITAVEFELITWAPDGWRDDTFMATVVFAAWAFIRFRSRVSPGNAALVGITAAAACLTRITAISFVLPAFAWLIVDAPAAGWRQRAKMAALAFVILAAIVSPYLISCAIATGDPLYAINYHTTYYRYSEGLPSDQPMSAATYISSKIARRPLAAIDTAATGLFVEPLVTKWHGLDAWIPGLGHSLFWCAICGLLMLPFSPAGRMLLVILFTSLLPYAFTWKTAGGGEWRFTMHAYPFFIVAACYAIDRACRGAAALWHNRGELVTPDGRSALPRAAAVAAVVIFLSGAYMTLPWFVVHEAIVDDDDVSIETGPRDLIFFGAGWSRPHKDGVMVRVSRAERAVVRVPLPARRDYDIVVRLDPIAPERQERVTFLLNRQLLGTLRLTWNPERMGSYRLHLPADKVREGSNELTIVPETLVPAASAGPRFAWLDPRERLGVRVWYVRVLRSQP